MPPVITQQDVPASDLGRQQAAVFELGRRALAGEQLDGLLPEILGSIDRSLRPALVTLFELLPGGRTGVVRHGRGWPGDGVPLPVTPGGHGALALRDRAPVAVEDFAAEGACAWADCLAERELRSGIAAPITRADGEAYGVLAVHWRGARDIDPAEVLFVESMAFVIAAAVQREQAEAEIRHSALHDPITQLPNRLLFEERVGDALRHAGDAPCAVVLLELDRLDLVNDTLGHHAGDELLRSVAARLRRPLPASDTLARIGDHLFAVLCDGVGEPRARERAAELTATLAAPFWVEEIEVFVTATSAVAGVAGVATTPQALLRDAEVALHRTHAGAGVQPDAQRRLLDRLRLEAELRRGLEDDQLRLVYQPLVALETGRIVGAEALVRWEHPDRGMVSPADFIPLAEETGLVVPLGAWVLEEACRQLARWSARHPAEAIPYVSVNVSARQLVDESFPALVAQVLARTGIDPSRLALETTESVLMERTACPIAALEELRALGVRLFLDDFGTGYSSLSYLKRFPLDALKIDRSFVSGIAEGEQDPHIVEAIVGMATALGLDVVAEGVETVEQVEQLLDVGCVLAQGYWFSRPVTPAAMEQLLVTGAPLGPPRTARTGAARDAAPAEGPTGETVTLGRAAEALGVSATTLRRWAESGRIAAVRTPGGHRRFAITEVARLSTALGTRRARPLAPLAPPTEPLPALRAELAAGADALLATTVRALYRGERPGGWFAAPEAEAALRRWTDALAAGCAAGDFAGAAGATLALDRDAALAGATLLERHTFAELFGEAAVRLLAGRSAERPVLLAGRRLFVSLRQALLAGACAQSPPPGPAIPPRAARA